MNTDVKELEVMEDIASLAVVTGEKKEKYLLWQLEISMAHALSLIFVKKRAW